MALYTYRRSITLDTTLAQTRPSMATKTTTGHCNLYCKACFWWICVRNWLALLQNLFIGGFQWLDVIPCFTNVATVTVAFGFWKQWSCRMIEWVITCILPWISSFDLLKEYEDVYANFNCMQSCKSEIICTTSWYMYFFRLEKKEIYCKTWTYRYGNIFIEANTLGKDMSEKFLELYEDCKMIYTGYKPIAVDKWVWKSKNSHGE